MFLICIILISSVFLAELYIKHRIERRYHGGKTRTLFNGKIIIQKLHNHGLAMGAIKDKSKTVLSIVSALFTLFSVRFLFRFRKKGNNTAKLGNALLLGGALSNLYDRIKKGYVVDYFSVNTKWKRVSSIVYNLSDLCIVLGAILTLFQKRKTKKHKLKKTQKKACQERNKLVK
ncbi:MAG: signal peptidase II [Clostridium sp.]|jgi:signal peptidase II|nr:signal peptidase II [Clostridium sp.]